MELSTPAWRTNNTAMNESDDYQHLYCATEIFTLNVLRVIVALAGLAGNAIVLWLLGFHMHRNAFSVYILNLAGADFLFLFFQTLYSLKGILYHVHAIFIGLPIYLLTVSNFAYLSSLSMLSAISTERCLSALWPIWYRCRRPRRTSAAMCALLWAFSLILSLLEGNACGIFFGSSLSAWCERLDFITFAWLIVLLVVLSGSSLALLLRVFCGSHRIAVTRLYVTIALTVLVFLLFGLSYGIYWFLLGWIGELYRVFPCNVYQVTAFLSCVNSCANPFIYFLVGSIRHHRFQRQTLKMLLRRAIQDTPEEEGRERSSSGQETV
ncbi:mas-related G-protein coupled receptor member X2 [Phodopus roborovskii]|uniref:LOC100912474 protein n=1 Tax=Phodopus roborovskii TaxID=109678 RepID=A0AAV0ABN2_PHORO|nr:mas-related G-protein coupled receptor member X2 [Phodopus roborovskii]CAH7459551.1 LOC100912474 [Phodopus roborovskii]